MTLNEVVVKEEVRVSKVGNDASIRRRLLDLGILEGTYIKAVLSSPSKHMRAYFVKGTLIALRDSESSEIEVEKGVDGLV